MIWNMSFTQQYSGNGWSCFGEDVNGELYIAGVNSGAIYKIVDANLSTEEHNLFKIKMYPNPVNNIVYLDFDEVSIILKSINIYSIQGKLIKSIPKFDNTLFAISTNNFSNGIYLIELIDKNGFKNTRKLIVSNHE